GLGLRLLDHASSSARDAKTEPALSWKCRWTGIPSRFSQRWTVLTSRLRCAAMSFHESSRSSGGFPGGGAAESGLEGSATLASGWRQDEERSRGNSNARSYLRQCGCCVRIGNERSMSETSRRPRTREILESGG